MTTETETQATTRRRAPFPGDGAWPARVAEMLRVDHAGEFGAVQIYKGQRAVFEAVPRLRRAAVLIADMEAGEKQHLETFDQLLLDRNVRPTLMAPLWRAAGFTLGAATALMGEKAAHACTAAVEEVIEQHYAEQAAELGDREPALRKTIEQFRADEIAHKTTALQEGAEQAPGYKALSAVIKFGCKLAIKVSEKI
jgi:ubiquinone biosynthesis monooxygenase Coq7